MTYRCLWEIPPWSFPSWEDFDTMHAAVEYAGEVSMRHGIDVEVWMFEVPGESKLYATVRFLPIVRRNP